MVCINSINICDTLVLKYINVSENREHLVVFDVGTGTGLAAEEVCYTYNMRQAQPV
jgi:hypothetical protein